MSFNRKAKFDHVAKRSTSLLLILLLILQMGAVSACKRKSPEKTPSNDGEYYFASYQNSACDEYLKDAGFDSIYESEAFFDADGNMYVLGYTEKASILVEQERGSDTCRSFSVPIKPGAIALTVTYGANWMARLWVNEISAAFEAS